MRSDQAVFQGDIASLHNLTYQLNHAGRQANLAILPAKKSFADIAGMCTL